MIDSTELFLYIARFLLGSSLLLGAVWSLEKVGLLANRDLADICYKTAIGASFLLLLPGSAHFAPQITLPTPLMASLPIKASQQVIPQDAAPVTITNITEPVNTSIDNKSQAPINSPATLPDFLIIPAIIAILALASLILTYMGAVRSLGQRQRVSADHQAFRVLFDICDKANIKATPYLTWSQQIQSPLCLPTGEICLPQWALEADLAENELQSLIAHEVAHLKRRDPIILLTLHALTRLFFLQPLLGRVNVSYIVLLRSILFTSKAL
jgi:beta-lactamase regulating signal transducer with metallopeptidase domain